MSETARQQRPDLTTGRILLVTLALLTALTPLATDMYLPAMPAMADELGVSASVVQLTLTTFLVGLAIGQLVIGPLSDQWGRRRLLVVGTVVCAVAGAACALAPGAAWLVGARFVQGFAGAAGIVLARAVISDVARGIRAAQLFSVMMVIQGVAPVVAPLLGGALVPAIGWRGVYWLLSGFTVLLVLAVVRNVPESHPVHLRSTGGLGALRRDARLVLTNRSYLGYTLSFVCCFGTLFAYIAASPFVLQNVLGLTPALFSVAFAVNSVGIIIASITSARIVARTGPRRLVVVGAAVMVGASLLLVVDATVWGLPLWPTLALLFPAAGSLGLIAGNATTLALAQVPGAAGTGSAVLGALQFTLAALVSPLVGIAGDRSAIPMVLTMAACAVLSAAAVALIPVREAVPGCRDDGVAPALAMSA